MIERLASAMRGVPRAVLMTCLGASLVAALAIGTTPAAAATSAIATTGEATHVTSSTATLNGSVNPSGSETSYYFQYGVTHLLGSQSAIATAGAGTSTHAVSLAIGGLAPLTLYHYRLVAVNAVGASFGLERTFMTPPVPLSLAITAAPDPVSYGGAIVVEGTLSGTFSGDKPVVLQASPLSAGLAFTNLGNVELTSALGGFSFPVLGLTQQTRFRVLTTTNPPIASPVVTEDVAVRVESHVAGARGGRVRIYGTVTPAENGMRVGILREVRGRGLLVAGTTLRAHGALQSSYSRTIPARRGLYRVLVLVTGAQSSAYGPPLLVR